MVRTKKKGRPRRPAALLFFSAAVSLRTRVYHLAIPCVSSRQQKASFAESAEKEYMIEKRMLRAYFCITIKTEARGKISRRCSAVFTYKRKVRAAVNFVFCRESIDASSYRVFLRFARLLLMCYAIKYNRHICVQVYRVFFRVSSNYWENETGSLLPSYMCWKIECLGRKKKHLARQKTLCVIYITRRAIDINMQYYSGIRRRRSDEFHVLATAPAAIDYSNFEQSFRDFIY